MRLFESCKLSHISDKQDLILRERKLPVARVKADLQIDKRCRVEQLQRQNRRPSPGDGDDANNGDERKSAQLPIADDFEPEPRDAVGKM